MTREAASPAPSATAGSSMWTVTGPRMFLQTGPSVWAPPGVNVRLVVSVCAEGAQINPPYYLVFEGDGQVMTVPLEARTAPSPLTPSPLLISVESSVADVGGLGFGHCVVRYTHHPPPADGPKALVLSP